MQDPRVILLDSARRLKPTIGSSHWLTLNERKVSLALPSDWVSAKDESFLLRFGFALKIAGVNWTERFDLTLAMQWLTKVGIAESIAMPRGPSDGQFWMIRRASTNTAA